MQFDHTSGLEEGHGGVVLTIYLLSVKIIHRHSISLHVTSCFLQKTLFIEELKFNLDSDLCIQNPRNWFINLSSLSKFNNLFLILIWFALHHDKHIETIREMPHSTEAYYDYTLLHFAKQVLIQTFRVQIV